MSNIKELIRREIERRIEWLNTATTDFAEGRRAEIRSLYDFLATLPDESEQPTMGYDEGYLNEKIAKASKSWEGVDVDKFMDEIRGREPVTDCHELEEEIERTYHDGSVANTDDMDHVDYENIARHFAEWGANHLRETTEKVSEDLEEAARAFVGFDMDCDELYEYETGIAAFKAGAEWQKKQDEENYAWVKQLPNPNIEKLDGIEITTSDSSAGGKELLYVSNKSYNIGLRDGMAEQKRKMMEGAVEADVNTYRNLEEGTSWAEFVVEMPTNNLGDKVRIIILPKED